MRRGRLKELFQCTQTECAEHMASAMKANIKVGMKIRPKCKLGGLRSLPEHLQMVNSLLIDL